MDLPFERQARAEVPLDAAMVSGGVVIAAALLPVPDGGPDMPALVFRFAMADGSGFYPPTVLTAELHQLEALVPLITQAVTTVSEAAR